MYIILLNVVISNWFAYFFLNFVFNYKNIIIYKFAIIKYYLFYRQININIINQQLIFIINGLIHKVFIIFF